MTSSSEQPDPDPEVDEEAEEERAGQSTTVEEAMDAATDEQGFAHESAYTPSTVDQDPEPDQ